MQLIPETQVEESHNSTRWDPNVKLKFCWMNLLMYSTIYGCPIFIVCHYWAKKILYNVRMSKGLETLKQIRAENEKLRGECKRLEIFLFDKKLPKDGEIKVKKSNNEYDPSKIEETLREYEEQLAKMVEERSCLLEQLEVARKEREDVKDEYAEVFMGLRNRRRVDFFTT